MKLDREESDKESNQRIDKHVETSRELEILFEVSSIVYLHAPYK